MLISMLEKKITEESLKLFFSYIFFSNWEGLSVIFAHRERPFLSNLEGLKME